MAKIIRFEEIKSWQLAREVVREIYLLTQKSVFSKDYVLKDQIRRASISVMSNIAEGFERYSAKEFIQYLVIAKGSIAEVRSQIYIASDLKYISEEDFLSMKDKCESISRHLSNFISYLKQSRKVTNGNV